MTLDSTLRSFRWCSVLGYTPEELRFLREGADVHRLPIAAEAIRIVQERCTRLLREERAVGAGAPVLARPEAALTWIAATVEGPRTYDLGSAHSVALDVVAYLAAREGTGTHGAEAPRDLVEEYLIARALEATGAPPLAAAQHAARAMGRQGPFSRGPLPRALGGYVAERCAANAPRSSSRAFRRGRGPVRLAAGAALGIAVLEAAVTAWPSLSGAGLALTLVSLAVAMVVVLGVALRHPSAMRIAMLFGVPLELPVRSFKSEEVLLREHAQWLARFSREKPRGFNTPGAHRAYGAIALKVVLKKACLRREAEEARLGELLARRSEAVRARNEWNERAGLAVARNAPEAVDASRREHGLNEEVREIDAVVFGMRLQIQDAVVARFRAAWRATFLEGTVSKETYEAIARELRQPEGEPPGLLPNGLVRGPLAFLFDYGTFVGRVLVAILFLATFRTLSFAWGAVLLVLELYVIEPVVLKLHIACFNLLLEAPGHRMVDLRSHLESEAAGVFHVPITVPKFSSNPAWTNLAAVLQTTARTSGIATSKITPFALRNGLRDTVIDLSDETRAARYAEALRSALAASRARFPLACEVRVDERRVIVTILADDRAIWDLIGEDASQAFLYLERNLHALRDTLTHLGPRFRPVFILASNTKDPDAIEYEATHIARLQELSNREYDGQVGFLYLLRGGAWHNHNAYLTAFESDDKDFVKAIPDWKRRLAEAPDPVQAHLLGKLLDRLDAKAFAETFNEALADRALASLFDPVALRTLEPHRRPKEETFALLARTRGGETATPGELRCLNRELLLTAMPMRSVGDFFKKVGNDIPVQELLVAGKTKPSLYVDRQTSEHVQDPSLPNYVRVWGDFARYTGLVGTNEEIRGAILRGEDVPVGRVPEVGAVIDDKNEFSPGEVEKGIATMLHPENRHIAIGVPRIGVTFPEHKGKTILSEYIVAAQGAREIHNTSDGQSRTRIYDSSSPAYGKWWKRPAPYLAHYRQEVLNAAHALSHDFQQSYLVAGASGRLTGFSEALYGPSHFRVRALPAHGPRRVRLAVALASAVSGAGLLLSVAYALHNHR